MGHVRDYLLPGAAEQDDSFRTHLALRSLEGLRALGIIEAAAALLAPSPWSFAAALVGALGFAVSWIPSSRSRARPVAWAAAFAAVALMIFAPSSRPALAVVMIAAAALVPFRPWETAALGLAAAAVSIAAGTPATPFLLVLAGLCSGVTVWLYAARRAGHESKREAVRLAGALAGAQLRAQLAENAVAVGKLAATLTHEINSPLGTMKSSIDTLLALSGRPAVASPGNNEHVLTMQAELRRSIHASSERIEEVVARLQSFVNLEDAELKETDLNALLRDTTLRLKNESPRHVRLELDFGDIPQLNCRPQLLSAGFHHLLKNAMDAVNGDGRIRISTRRLDSLVEIRVQDNGRGMPPEQIDNIFDPGFKVSGERVRSGNWSLFNLRQIVYLHGGDIQAASAVGKGTTISITLPCGG